MSVADRPEPPADSDDGEIDTAADDAIAAANDEHLLGSFYRGLIVFLDRVRGRGMIRSFSGREIHFEFPFVAVIGAPIGGRAPGIDLIRQGDTVGFDVGWTSKGLRVTRIKPARSR
ncbi:MAG: hypothetical protein ACREQC_06665 [Candidatus Binataceae bacterium]